MNQLFTPKDQAISFLFHPMEIYCYIARSLKITIQIASYVHHYYTSTQILNRDIEQIKDDKQAAKST